MAEPAEPKAVKKKEQSVPFYKLFSCADGLDWLLLSLGSLGAIVHGSAMPVFFLFFGDLVNGFGKSQEDPLKIIHEVSKYALYFVYLGLVVCASSYADAYDSRQNSSQGDFDITMYLKSEANRQDAAKRENKEGVNQEGENF